MNTSTANAPTKSRALRRTEMLSDLEDAIVDIRDLDIMLDVILDITAKETHCERTSLFLNDPSTNQLFTRSAMGLGTAEIRMPNDAGLAGHSFQTRESIILNDAYADPRFNRESDKALGFKTRNILCVPVHTMDGEVIGAAQALNKIDGEFTADDQACLEAMGTRAARALVQAEFAERMNPSFIRILNNFFRYIFGDKS